METRQARESPTVEDLFHAALEITAADRKTFLDDACRHSARLRAEVESLLAAHQTAPELLRDWQPCCPPNDEVHDPDGGIAQGAPPPRVPGFQVRHCIGAGTLGEVYLAHDEVLGRTVAIKVLRVGTSLRRRDALLTEARRAASLRHPAIVTLHAVVETDGQAAIVMEHVEGYPIDRALSGLPFRQRADVLAQVARGLAHAHAAGVIHRDLKPDNILVTPDLQPKILDFGLAISVEESAAWAGGFEGTPLYASPEQASCESLTPASDVFAFGILMFVALTGRSPFSGATAAEVLAAIRNSSPPFLRDVAVGVPEDLQAICLACLSADPARRPSADLAATELDRYLAGEPIRLRPALYDDILRRRLSEYAQDISNWEHQGMVSRDEADRMEAVHRRILADEDHWIIDARRVTLAQTILYTSTWLVVVSAVFLVWLVRDDLGPAWRCTIPLLATGSLLAVGAFAELRREPLAAASFLASAILSTVPVLLSLLAEFRLFSLPTPGVTQLLGTFTNDQIAVSFLVALALSVLALGRLRMTGFAWTSALLTVGSYAGCLLLCNWLEQRPEIAALWCLPLTLLEGVALALERRGRVRWSLPFHTVAVLALVVSLDVIAATGPTLHLLGLDQGLPAYLVEDRLATLSFALNGLFFLLLMLVTERAASLDLRRISRLLEWLATPHLLVPLYFNATGHREAPWLLVDVGLYLTAAGLLLVLGPWRSHWRILVTGLAGTAVGSHLLLDLELVAKTPFVIGLGTTGLVAACGTYGYLALAPRWRRRRKESVRERARGSAWPPGSASRRATAPPFASRGAACG